MTIADYVRKVLVGMGSTITGCAGQNDLKISNPRKIGAAVGLAAFLYGAYSLLSIPPPSYASRFSAADVQFLKKEFIGAERANAYPARFSTSQIINLNQERISPAFARSFNQRFSTYDLYLFHSPPQSTFSPLEPQKVNAYAPRFESMDIIEFLEHDLQPDAINQYDSRFDCSDIIALQGGRAIPGSWRVVSRNSQKIPPAVANNYLQRFNGEDIATLFRAGVDTQRASAFSERFHGQDIASLVHCHVQPSLAVQYDTSFPGALICKFVEKGVTPPVALHYKPILAIESRDPSWQVQAVIDLLDNNLSPEQWRDYNPSFFRYRVPSFNEEGDWYAKPYLPVLDLIKNGIPARKANAYDVKSIAAGYIPELVKNKIAPTIVTSRYLSRFGFNNTLILLNAGIRNADKYDERFRRYGIGDIIDLAKAGIQPREANSADPELSTFHIITARNKMTE